MTMIPNKYTRPFGCENLHAVLFQSCADRGGVSPAVVIMIPAADAKQVALDLLPDHREVSLSRAEAGVWGLN